ncbi:MAG: M91 family zinc metallopeptidase [Acidobacteriota bacterium]
MSWLGDAFGTVSHAVSGAVHGVENTAHNAATSVSSWLGTGPNTHDAATAHGGDALHSDAPTSLWGRIGQGIGDFGRGVRQEGLRGLLDPSGMLDRQLAQRQLSDRFQVVGDNVPAGARASNQVSEAEYERIARTFSNIRMGRGDLRLDGSDFSPFAGNDRRNWENGMQANIADMMMTRSGRDQIYGMSNNVVRNDDGTARHHLWGLGPEIHHQTDITPLFGVQRKDAHGNPVLDSNGAPVYDDPGWFHRNASTMRHDNAFAAANDWTKQGRDPSTMARGEGSDSTLHINPGSILGLRTDVVLAHEMQHARQETQGTMAVGKFGSGPDTNINNYERQAVGLSRSDTPTGGHYPGDPDGCTENTYRQERNALGDRFLPRTNYSSLPGEAPATMTDAQLQAAWAAHNASPNAGH